MKNQFNSNRFVVIALLATLLVLPETSFAKKDDKDKKSPNFTTDKDKCFTKDHQKKKEKLLKENVLDIQACSDAGLDPFPSVQKTAIGMKGTSDNDKGPKGTMECSLVRKEDLANLGLDAFASASAKTLERIEGSKNTARKKAATECLVRGLYTWAAKDGMLKVDGYKPQGDRPRTMALMPAVAAYVRSPEVRELAKSLSASGKQSYDDVIRSWLNKLSKDFVDASDKLIAKNEFNNHHYAHGMLNMGIALINKDKSLAKFAQKTLMIGMDQINADGFLPDELERGTKTLTYHTISVYQLTGILAYGSVAPCLVNLNNAQEEKFIKLFVSVLRSQHNPNIIKKAANTKQLSDKSGVALENYLILLKMTQPSLYGKLAQEIKKQTKINPQTYVTGNKAKRASRREFGGDLMPLGEVLSARKAEFKEAFCGS